MAAPKGAGCFFGGDLQGEPKRAVRLPGRTLDWLEIDWLGRRSRIPAAAGRGLPLSRGA
jgi:hypothetical protein